MIFADKIMSIGIHTLIVYLQISLYTCIWNDVFNQEIYLNEIPFCILLHVYVFFPKTVSNGSIWFRIMLVNFQFTPLFIFS